MSILLADIKEKAKRLINIAEPITRRQTVAYDSTKNTIIVAGITLEGVTSSVVNSKPLTKQDDGIDYYYTTYYTVTESRTLTVNLLPTSRSLLMLRELALKQQTIKGWFNIAVHENDTIVDVYRGWILELPEITMQMESPDRTVIFGIKSMYTGTSLIDQPTQTEDGYYKRYGTRNDRSYGSNDEVNDNVVVDENSGLAEIPFERDDSVFEPPPIEEDNGE